MMRYGRHLYHKQAENFTRKVDKKRICRPPPLTESSQNAGRRFDLLLQYGSNHDTAFILWAAA